MSLINDDLHPEISGGPLVYRFDAYKQIFATPIEFEGETVAFLFHGSDEEPEAAGLILKTGHSFRDSGARYWKQRLMELRAKEVPAAEAVKSLLNATGPKGAGQVGGKLLEYSGKRVLEDQMNPMQVARRAEYGARGPSSQRQVAAAQGLEVPASALDDMRKLMDRAPYWREVHSDYNPKISHEPGTIFTANGFDEAYWGLDTPGSVLELWHSEREVRQRTFRTDDPEGFLAKVVCDGLKRQGKRLWRQCEFDRMPPGFQIEDISGGEGVSLEWGDGSWAEFLGSFQLTKALEFCQFMIADPVDIAVTVASRDGAPLLQKQSRTVRCGPPANRHGEITVNDWKQWLDEQSGSGA